MDTHTHSYAGTFIHDYTQMHLKCTCTFTHTEIDIEDTPEFECSHTSALSLGEYVIIYIILTM